MKFGVYSIRDLRTGFMAPTLDQSDAVAHRNFSNAIQRSDGVLFTHAEDFQLMCIGEFESDSGEITPCVPRLVVDGSSVLSALQYEPVKKGV